jgi:galactose mutarotase-like enzyme
VVTQSIEQGNSKVTFAPERGGLITSLVLGGREVLYMDEETLNDFSKNVRGGIPLLFPNAGSIEDPRYPGLKQHGLARTSSKWEATIAPDKLSFIERLRFDEETLKVYPYKFSFEIEGQLVGEDTFILTTRVTNLETDKDLPLALGLHPYFPIKKEKKPNIIFDFPGGEVFAEEKSTWMSDGTIRIPNPGRMRVVIPDLGTLIFVASPEFKRLWVWSTFEGDFICIEPTMRDPDGLLYDPELIAPAKIFESSFSIILK